MEGVARGLGRKVIRHASLEQQIRAYSGEQITDTRLKMATLAVENCLAVLEGKAPPTPVNPEVLSAARK